MFISRQQFTLPISKHQDATNGRTERLQQAINILNRHGFTNLATDLQDGKETLIVFSTRARINEHMRGIIEATKTGVLIRCKTELPEE